MLFLGLSDSQLQSVAGVIRSRTFRSGEVVVRKGDLDDALYIIERGSVELRTPESGEEGVAAVFEKGSYVDEGYAGDFFGEFSLIDLEPWTGTVVARERTVLLELKRDDLYELFSRDIDLQIGVVLNIARVLSRRLRIRNRRARLRSPRRSS
jgi:CRP-like cAMP-binding protein